ncbi:MAG: flagellar basal body P-ring protein FlgI [Bacteriovoracia bacterium]
MKKNLKKTLGVIFIVLFSLVNSSFAARIKDIVTIKGVRDNVLIGYGIVIGLKGTGDGSAELASKSMARMFEKLGIQAGTTDFKSKNVAAVIVTAKLPPFSRTGTKIDATVSSIGDASSLEGGILLVTPLRAGDQQVYAVAQGPISLGGLTDGGGGGGGAAGGKVSFPTVARIANGAIVEKEIDGNFTSKKTFVLSINNPDFTTSARLAKLINTELGGKYAVARDAATIDLITPYNYDGNGVELMAMLENLEVATDTKARVVLNERTGTVVMGENVRIDNVAISHGELSIEVSAPPAPTGAGLADASPAPRAPASGGKNKGPKDKIGIVGGSSIKDVVRALNSLGVAPKDMTAIFQALRASGALQADLEIL